MTKITRGNPPNLKNVRSNIYHHYIRVDNPATLMWTALAKRLFVLIREL